MRWRCSRWPAACSRRTAGPSRRSRHGASSASSTISCWRRRAKLARHLPAPVCGSSRAAPASARAWPGDPLQQCVRDRSGRPAGRAATTRHPASISMAAASACAALASIAADWSTPVSRALGKRARNAGNTTPVPQPKSTTAAQRPRPRPAPAGRAPAGSLGPAWRAYCVGRPGRASPWQASGWQLQPATSPTLRSAAARSWPHIEVGDQLHEQPVPVHLCLQVQEHRAQADRGPVHEHELARRRDAADLAQLAGARAPPPRGPAWRCWSPSIRRGRSSMSGAVEEARPIR